MNIAWAEQIARQGLNALQSGDAANAQVLLGRAIDAGYRHPDVFVALGYAHKNQGAKEAAAAEFTRALSLDPRHLRALLAKAETLQDLGRETEAVGFYASALKLTPDPESTPKDLRAVFSRGFELMQRRHAQLETALNERFSNLETLKQRSPRFAESVDILLGHARPHYQKPTKFYYPGLPERAVYDRADFDWAEEIEAQTGAILEELQVVLAEGDIHLRPYLEVDEGMPRLRDSDLINNIDWGAYYLWRHGEIVADAAERCPRTIAALGAAPLDFLSKQAPSNLFSVLKPGAHIPPHHGMLNTRLICHLPLIIPPNCALRVGNQLVEWKLGELIIFDDSVEHEAWNRSDETRVILLFEIWKPELSREERAEISALFEILAADGA